MNNKRRIATEQLSLLDHRLVEFDWQLPASQIIKNGQGKWVLRQVLNQYVPRALIDRLKMGFGVLNGTWLRGPHRGWAASLLDESRLRQEGFFDPALIHTEVDGTFGGHKRLAVLLVGRTYISSLARMVDRLILAFDTR